jgi:single-strand DNA-binding protein
MASLNKVTLIGRLGKDPETRNLENGKSVVNFALATEEKYKNEKGELIKVTDWHNLVGWNSVANVIGKYCRKGSQIFVEGKLRTRSWEKDNITRYVTEIIVENVQLLDSKPKDQNTSVGPSSASQQQYPEQSFAGSNTPPDNTTDDLPF